MPFEVELTGHLTRLSLARKLSELEARTTSEKGHIDVMFDCLEMTDYDYAARETFIDWHRRMKKRLRKVAIVTEKRLWHLVVAAMALASGTPMKAFHRQREALEWLTVVESGKTEASKKRPPARAS